MKILNSTEKWSIWWEKRKIDWNEHYMNPEHPHRMIIVEVLKRLRWTSLMEVGCGAGANLVAIVKAMPNRQVGGVDINKDAVDACNKTFTGGLFKVNRGDDIMMSDKATDIILSDMYLIYVTKGKIRAQLREFKRVARDYIVLCELHSKSFKERFVFKWKEGLNVYDYQKLLESEGFYDIQMFKVPKEMWPESDAQQKYCNVIVATVPEEY